MAVQKEKNIQKNIKKEKNKFSKTRAAGAICVTAAALLAAGLAVAGEGMDVAFLATALIAGIAAGAFVLYRITFGRVFSGILCALLPAAAFLALENYTHVVADLDVPIIVLNLLFFYFLYGFLAFACGSVRLGYSIATLVPMLFGLANYFVVNFRGTPIVPWDLLSLGTAASVAGNYTFTLQWKQALVIVIFLWILVLSQGNCLTFRKKKKLRFIGVLAFALALCVYLTGIQKSQVQSFFGMDTTLFTLNVLYRNNGIAAAFLGNLRFLNIEEPDGYSTARVKEIEEEYTAAETGASEAADGTGVPAAGDESGQTGGHDAAQSDETSAGERPNVIVIMDEAFSDLSVWGDFETSEEVMPFFKMMQEEKIGGELYVSVKGGNTANTEFELLTGDSMAFLPVGSVPYQQYINEEMPSLASQLKSLGYGTTAIHPFNASGWDRNIVYDLFGFDEFLSLKDFVNPHKMRGYVSDRSAFDKIIEVYEDKEPDERKFIYLVTMQNHGGYSKASPDFTSYLKLTDVSPKTTSVLATEKYLTLMNETDRALQDLLLYFEEQDEPTIVLMFGDHQPSDYITNVVQRICKVKSEETLDYVQQGYRVPFLLWSNYELEHKYYDGISVNYLGGILMEAAGLPLSGYQRFLSEQMERFPVVNGNVYRDSEGTFYSYGTDEEKESGLSDYKILQYNHLVDNGHRDDAFFGTSIS